MVFEQPVVKIDKEKEFEELKGSIDRAFAPQEAERFLKRLAKSDIRVRRLEELLEQGILNKGKKVTSGTTAKALYQALTVSDQAQMREFYLSRIEEIDPKLRHKFRKLYQYY